MNKQFPQQDKAYIQNNRSNVFPMGNIWSSFNVDLQSNQGVLRISPRLKVNRSTADDADLGCPVAFSPFNTIIYAVCGTRIFTNADCPNDIFTEDASTNAATDYSADYSDLCQFNDVLFATSDDTLRSLSGPGGTWTDRDTFANTTRSHKLLYFKYFNRLYWSHNGQFINSCGTDYAPADTGDYTLTWDGLVDFVDFKSTYNAIWIAGKVDNTSRTENGVVWEWDGISAQITREYQIPGTTGVYALAIDPERDIPVAMGDNGVLYQFNGTGFKELGRLPFTTQLPYAGSTPIASSSKNDRFIHPNGMIFTKNGTIQCLINGKNNDSTGSQNENIPSGIWEWSKENGFVHRYSFSYDPITDSITDFGQNKVSRVGALGNFNIPNTTAGRDGTILAGATLFTNASDTTNVIAYDNSLDTIQKKGYVVTTWYESDEIADAWDEIWTSFRKFLNTNDSIVCKYRIEEVAPVEGAITWVNTTSFTVLNSAVVVSDYWTSGTGGEVEILRGTGGGVTAHITNAVNNAGTWTVTIDEIATGVTTGTATARFQKWIKLSPAEALASTSTWANYAIGTNSTPRIQFKICFTYTGQGEFYKSIIKSNEDITPN